VGPLTADMVRSLAARKSTTGPIVSLYLDVDGQRHIRARDYEHELDRMLREVRERGGGAEAAEADLRRVEAFVKAGIDRSRTRGIAVFASSADALFETVELAVGVRNHLAVDHIVHIRQLEGLLERYRRYGVLLIDRQRARLMVFRAGEVHDRSELFDELPRHDDDGGGWDRDHVRDHAEAQAQHHLRRAAQAAFSLHQERPFDHLVLSGPEAAVNDVERELHSYLRERIVARLHLPVTSSDDELRAAVAAVEADVERARADTVVSRLRDAIGVAGAGLIGLPGSSDPAPIGSGAGSGVAGLGGVLQALGEHRVEVLVVSEGYATAGWSCPGCGRLAAVGPHCTQCEGSMERVEDVVEEAVEMALAQSCRLAVCAGNADLDVLGRIGALLRF